MIKEVKEEKEQQEGVAGARKCWWAPAPLCHITPFDTANYPAKLGYAEN
jgi:hypothetical protein